jgi:hypothetical protein
MSNCEGRTLIQQSVQRPTKKNVGTCDELELRRKALEAEIELSRAMDWPPFVLPRPPFTSLQNAMQAQAATRSFMGGNTTRSHKNTMSNFASR